MKMKLFLALTLAFALPSFAAARAQNTAKAAAAKPTASKEATGFKAEFFTNLDDAQEKIMDLAASIPAEKYGWRPAADVRSISEVFMHVAGGNFAAAAVAGRPAANEDETLEQIVEKERVLDTLRKSFEQLRAAMLNTSDADLDRSVRMYGSDISTRAAFMTAINHVHEHLGQSIAYARMNGIVPPWSAN